MLTWHCSTTTACLPARPPACPPACLPADCVYVPAGIKMKASFAAEGEGGSSSLFGRLACVALPRVKG
jgi:hypothetical protein